MEFGDGDGGDVEGVAESGFKSLDAALAENDFAVALREDVFGGHEPFGDGAGEAAFEEHGLARFADLEEKVEVLHVACADLEDVGVALDDGDVTGVHHFGNHGHVVLFAGVAEPFEGFLAVALEAVGRSAGLVGSAAEDGGAGGFHFAGQLMDHGFFFGGAGAGDGEAMGAPDGNGAALRAGDFDDGVFLVELAAGEFVGLHDRQDLFDAIDGFEVLGINPALLADDADDGAELSAREVGLKAQGFNLRNDVIDESFGGFRFEDDDHGRSVLK